MREQRISVFSLLVSVFGIIALALTIFAISQSTGFRIKAEKSALLVLWGEPQQITKGQTMTVHLDVQTNLTPIQTVFVNLTYPTTKMQLLKIETSHSPFESDAGTYHKSGYVTIGRSTGFPRSGTTHIASLSFRAKDTVTLKDIQSIPGTSILNEENRNIYLQTVTSSPLKQEKPSSVIQFVVNFVENLFAR